MPCVSIFRKNAQLWLFRPTKIKLNFKNPSPNSESALPRYHVYQFSGKTDNFEFLGPDLLNLIFGVGISKIKSGFGINTSNIPCVSVFSQNGQLLIFRSTFWEIAQSRAIFWFKYCWGCCRELGGGWNELDGGGWSWVEVGARFNNTYLKTESIHVRAFSH